MSNKNKLLRLLHQHGAYTKEKGLNVAISGDTREYKGFIVKISELNKIASELIQKDYLDGAFYSVDMRFNYPKLVLTNRARDYINQLSNPWYTKLEKRIAEHKRLTGSILFILALIVYAIRGYKIETGFDLVDAFKTALTGS